MGAHCRPPGPALAPLKDIGNPSNHVNLSAASTNDQSSGGRSMDQQTYEKAGTTLVGFQWKRLRPCSAAIALGFERCSAACLRYLRQRDAVNLQIKLHWPGRDRNEGPRRRVGREEARIDLVDRRIEAGVDSINAH